MSEKKAKSDFIQTSKSIKMGTMDVPLITLVLVVLLLSVFTTSTIAIRLEEKGKKMSISLLTILLVQMSSSLEDFEQ